MRMKYLAVVATMALSTGCHDDGLSAGTYDLGLAPGFVPLAAERAPRTIEALAGQPLDVACVQGVWRAGDVSALENATASTWPFQIFPAPDPGPSTIAAPCDASALDPVQTCVASTCGDLSSDALMGCVAAKCEPELGALPASCSSCLAANLGAPFDELRLACTAMPDGDFMFGGSFGIGLVSRYPLLDQDFLPLDATFARRGVIYARIEVPSIGTVHTFCTQLTPILTDIAYPGPGSFETEQRAQINALLDFIAAKAEPDDRVLLMGDFGTGPELTSLSDAGASVTGVATQNYTLLLSAVTDPYVGEKTERACTVCASNPLVPDDAPSTIVDHVFVREMKAHDRAFRFLTQDIQIDGATAAFSNHYGIRTTLSD